MTTTGRMALIAAASLFAAAAPVRGEWILVQPPIVGEKRYECVYDTSAPIARWNDAFGRGFETVSACEEMRAELVRRTTAPGRKERLVAAAEQQEKDAIERRMRRMMPKERVPGVCSSGIESYAHARCIERAD
jgi:hypothetical protein